MVLSILFEYQNLNEYNVMSLVYPLIQKFSKGSTYPDVACVILIHQILILKQIFINLILLQNLIYLLRCSYFALLWHLVEIFDCISQDQISSESMKKLQKIFENYMALYESIFSRNLITRVRKEV